MNRRFAEWAVMNDEERDFYEKWVEARTPYRDGSAQQRAYIDGFRDGRKPAPAPVDPDEDPWSPR